MHLACHRLIKAPNPASSPGELVFTPLGTARSADSALRRPRAAWEPGLWQACALVGRGWVCCCHSRLQVCRAGGNGHPYPHFPPIVRQPLVFGCSCRSQLLRRDAVAKVEHWAAVSHGPERTHLCTASLPERAGLPAHSLEGRRRPRVEGTVGRVPRSTCSVN